MFKLKNVMDNLEKLMTASAFAEADQRDMALEIMNEKPATKNQRKSEKAHKRVDQRPVLRA